MENEKNVGEFADVESIDLNFEIDLASAYKPIDELFDTILDDDGYVDYQFTKQL